MTLRRFGGWQSIRTPRPSSAATASSATSTRSTRRSTSPRTTRCSWIRTTASASGTKGRASPASRRKRTASRRRNGDTCVLPQAGGARQLGEYRRRHVLVPRGAGIGVAPFRRRQRVRSDPRHQGAAVLAGVVEPETVGQGRMSGQHRLGDLDGRLGAAGRGGDPGPPSVYQAQAWASSTLTRSAPSASRLRQDGSRKMSLAV